MSLGTWLTARLFPNPRLTGGPDPDELFVCHYKRKGREERILVEQPPRYQHVYVHDRVRETTREYLIPFPWTYYQLWSVDSWSREKQAGNLVDIEAIFVRPWELDKEGGLQGLALYRPPLPNTWPDTGSACTPSRMVPGNSPESVVRTALSWFWADAFNTDLQPWRHPMWRNLNKHDDIHDFFSRWAAIDLGRAHRLPWDKSEVDWRLLETDPDTIVHVPLADFAPQ